MTNEAPDFLMEASKKEEKNCDLERLAAMVTDLSFAQDEVDKIEEQLKEAKACKNRLSQEIIPEYLGKYNISEIRLADGRKVIVDDDVSVTVKNKDAFFNFLKERKEDSVIKYVVSFERMDPEKQSKLFEFLIEKEYDCKSEQGVHSQTQKKYFKELLGIGKEPDEIQSGLSSGVMVLPKMVEDFAKIFAFKKTKIK